MYGNYKFEQIFTHCTFSRGHFFFLSNRANAQNVEKKTGWVNTSFVSLRLPHYSHRERQEVIESIGAGTLLKTL